jgi:hypothetical protein
MRRSTSRYQSDPKKPCRPRRRPWWDIMAQADLLGVLKAPGTKGGGRTQRAVPDKILRPERVTLSERLFCINQPLAALT